MKKLSLILFVSALTFVACNKAEAPTVNQENPTTEVETTAPENAEVGSLPIDENNKLSVYVKNPKTDSKGFVTGDFYVGLWDAKGALIQEINLSTYNPFAGDGGGVPADATSNHTYFWDSSVRGHNNIVKTPDGLFEITLDEENGVHTLIVEFYDNQIGLVQ